MIRDKLRRSERQIRFRAEVATPSNLRELLNDGCRMLHYTGHGSKDFLAFESDQDRCCGVMEPLQVTAWRLLSYVVALKAAVVAASKTTVLHHGFDGVLVWRVVAPRSEVLGEVLAPQKLVSFLYGR